MPGRFVFGGPFRGPTLWRNPGPVHALMLLLLLIGFQMRNSGMRLRQILLNPWGMKIALTVILSSWLGSLLAAQLLGMSRKTLYNKLESLDLEKYVKSRN